MRQIRFALVQREPGSLHEIEIRIDGADLVEVIGAHERSQGYDPAGAYGGLIPAIYRFGPLTDHFLARADRDRVPLLGCECGEWGCWPLMARIEADDDQVRWVDLGQSHRPAWRYDAIEPFVFGRAAYDEALADLEQQLARVAESS